MRRSGALDESSERLTRRLIPSNINKGQENLMAKDIQTWNPEDAQEWAASGKAIATRNLWISIPSVLCGYFR